MSREAVSRVSHTVAILTVALLLCLPGLGAKAQVDTDEVKQQLIDSANRTLEAILEDFRPHVDEKHRHLLDPDKISVTPDPEFHARATYTGRIKITFAIVHEVHLQALAYAYMQRWPASGKHHNAWLGYLADRSERIRDRIRRGEVEGEDEPMLNFWEHAKLKRPGSFSEAELAEAHKFTVNSLALVLAHELGHVILGHNTPPVDKADSRERERVADDYAADLVRKTYGSAIAGLRAGGYLRFLINEELYRPFDQVNAGHPQADCRLSRLLKAELVHLLGSRAAADDYLSSQGVSQDDIDYVAATEAACEASAE